MNKVHCKKEMYRLMAAGEFGNYNPHWMGVESWARAHVFKRAKAEDLWGIRSVGAGKHLRLDVPTFEVAKTVREEFAPISENMISPMVDHILTYRGEVMFSAENRGITLRGGPGKRKIKWREFFANESMTLTGLNAWLGLRAFMMPGDYEDFLILIEKYPDHVIEFTCCDKWVGAKPRRNTIIWEVRPTDGSYENWNTSKE